MWKGQQVPARHNSPGTCCRVSTAPLRSVLVKKAGGRHGRASGAPAVCQAYAPAVGPGRPPQSSCSPAVLR